jgi:hypothetical protein
MEYKIVYGDYSTNLEKVVKHWLERGWEFQGGVAFQQSNSGGLWAQAMVKHENTKPLPGANPDIKEI